ncbi:hypothetical protein [Haliangium sp.]|uniref:hypothetical protein n=1 Tax=Haliangium sp. TaxID=2663208 RepID=UPI003D13E481
MTARKERLRELAEASSACDRARIDASLFRALYGLPADMQLELARVTIARFLPIFLTHYPDVTWVVPLVEDPEAYYREHEQGMPLWPEMLLCADASFDFALCALLRAWSYVDKNELPRVTPACCTAVIWAIGARATNAWHADEPEVRAAFVRRDRGAFAGLTEDDNAAGRAVKQREWLLVVDWLEAHAADDYPELDEAGRAERDRWFEWWMDRECLL